MIQRIKNLIYKIIKPSKIDSLLVINSKNNLDELILNTPALKKNATLFLTKEDPDNAIFYRMKAIRPILCIEGYFRSAITLLNEIEKNYKNNLIKDSLLYPALHNIHQYLELVMKETISNYQNKAPYDVEHNLHKIWNKFIRVSSIDKKTEEVIIIDKLIQEFSRLSNKSMAFRYPYSDGAIDNTKYVDIKLLKERFIQLYRFFDGIHSLSLDQD